MREFPFLQRSAAASFCPTPVVKSKQPNVTEARLQMLVENMSIAVDRRRTFLDVREINVLDEIDQPLRCADPAVGTVDRIKKLLGLRAPRHVWICSEHLPEQAASKPRAAFAGRSRSLARGISGTRAYPSARCVRFACCSSRRVKPWYLRYASQ